MKSKIAAGFQNTVDFELKWEPQLLWELMEKHRIRSADIRPISPISCERELLQTLLYHMRSGSGGECLAVSSSITKQFASRFSYHVTLGGTAVRAAIAIQKLGYTSTIHACSLNHYFKALIPPEVHWLASVPDEGEDFHPHVIFQYPSCFHLVYADIDFTTMRPNRVIFTHDPPSIALHISEDFCHEVSQTPVLLVASYNIMKDSALLAERLQATIRIIQSLPEQHTVIMEDGCFELPAIRQQVGQTLAPWLDLFSMNEDELQDRIGRHIDVRNPSQVAGAIQQVYEQLQVPVVVCHSAYWALAYGRQPQRYRAALEGGILMAATRFRLGDDYLQEDYRQTALLPSGAENEAFCLALAAYLDTSDFVCLPGKDLRFVKTPTTIGLGDAFAGGMLPYLIP